MESTKDIAVQLSTLDLHQQLDINAVPHIFEHIFSFLDTRSLCNSGLVCHEWNDIIMNSKKLSTCFRISIDLVKDSRDVFSSIRSSSRRFSNIEIKNFVQPNERIVDFLENYQWKAITLNLQLVEFPKLPTACVENLTSLDVITAELRNISELLKSSVNLKHFKLNVTITADDEWQKIIRADMFRLSSLQLRLNVSSTFRRVDEFLGAQVGSLTQLYLEGVDMNRETLQVISEMPKLNSLTLINLVCDMKTQDRNFELREMTSLQFLKFLEGTATDEVLFEVIVKLSPNLRILEVIDLSQSRFELAGVHLRKLTELNAAKFEFKNISNPDWFAQLQIIKIMCCIEKSSEVLRRNGKTKFELNLKRTIVKSSHNEIVIKRNDQQTNILVLIGFFLVPIACQRSFRESIQNFASQFCNYMRR